MSGHDVIPRKISHSSLKRHLRKVGIEWQRGKGKGSHGSFVGFDAKGKKQSFTIPISNGKEVWRTYLKGLIHRFGFTDKQIAEIFPKTKSKKK